MTRPAALIIGDWGNSNARAWLCARDGAVIDERRGPGIAALRSDPAAIATAFAAMSAGWPSDIPALVAGVVGASYGWRDAGYLSCPIAIPDMGSHAVRAPTNERAVWITPGIRCINAWGEPDTMRGEELQIVGWAARATTRDALIALPGTHCKWARVKHGQVTDFHSTISGELFAMLREHSVMIDRAAQQSPHDPAAFAEGAALAKHAANVDLSALLFSARGRQATGAMSAGAAASFVSGLVIGCDVRTALLRYSGEAVAVVGADPIAHRYASVLSLWNVDAIVMAGDAAMHAGLIASAANAGLV
jgi:2-dehydro-3-deoxygalactonokinase